MMLNVQAPSRASPLPHSFGGEHKSCIHPRSPVGASLLAIAISGEYDPVAANLTDTNPYQGHGTVADLKQRVIAHL